MTKKTVEQELAGLQLEIKFIKKALSTLIDWTAQSANSPIRRDEAATLLNWLNGHD